MIGNEKQISSMQWILFWIFITLFVIIVIATLSMVFLGFGEPTENERSLLFKVFIGEIGISVVALFYSLFGLKSKNPDDQSVVCTELSKRSEIAHGKTDAIYKSELIKSINIDSEDKLKSELIRLSISALFRIKFNNEYLLVRGRWINNIYQPVGGVLKRLPSSYHLLSKMGVLDDDKIPTVESTKDDLRVRVPGASLYQFLKWYESGIGREVSPWREFHEELIASGILPTKKFPYIHYEHIKRCTQGIQFSTHFQCQELLIAEIYEIFPNDEQKLEFERIQKESDDQYLWATEKQIRTRGVIPGISFDANISSHSSWLL